MLLSYDTGGRGHWFLKEGLFATTTVSFIESFRLAFAFLIHLRVFSFPSQSELTHTLLRRRIHSFVLH